MKPLTKQNIQLVLVIIITFLITFATSLLLELEIFKNPVRYVLVVILMLIEIFFGYIIFTYLLQKSTLGQMSPK